MTIAIGTETDGSIVCPLRASTAWWYQADTWPRQPNRHRSDCAQSGHGRPHGTDGCGRRSLLTAIAGSDADDAATRVAGRPNGSPTVTLDRNALRGARIGVVRNRLFGSSPSADALANAAIADLKAAGAVIVDPANIPTLGASRRIGTTVLLYEFKGRHSTLLHLVGAGAPVHSLADIAAFNSPMPPGRCPYFGQELVLQSNAKGPLQWAATTTALAKNHRLAGRDGIDAVMAQRLDALVAPTGGPGVAHRSRERRRRHGHRTGPSTVAAVAGYPHVTVPMGQTTGFQSDCRSSKGVE